MELSRISELKGANPFRPFNIILDDGRKFPVEKSYFVGISPTKRFITHSSVDGGFEVIRTGQLRDIDFEIDDRGNGLSPRQGAA